MVQNHRAKPANALMVIVVVLTLHLANARGEPMKSAKSSAAGSAATATTPANLLKMPKGWKLPEEVFQGEYGARARALLQRHVLYKRSSVEIFPCEPPVLEWLFDHPEIVSRYWHELSPEIPILQRMKDGFEFRQSAREQAEFHLLFQNAEMRIIYCTFESRQHPMPGTMRGEILLVHRYRFVRHPSGAYHAAHQMEGYVGIQGVALQTIARWTKTTCEDLLDRGLQELMMFFSVMSRLVHMRPHWALDTWERFERFVPDDERNTWPALLKKMCKPTHALER